MTGKDIELFIYILDEIITRKNKEIEELRAELRRVSNDR